MAAAPELTQSGATATITFHRPEKRNALSLADWRSLPLLVAEVEARRDVRVLIVRGSGGSFAAGANIAEFDEVFADRAATLDYAGHMAAAMDAIAALSIPTIAAIEGLCIGAGVAVALACDLRFAAEEARFAVPPAKLGLMYSLADTKRLVDAVGLSATKDLLFTGRTINAGQALLTGLVDEVFGPDRFQCAVAERATAIVEASPWSVMMAKRIVRLVASGTTAETAETRGLFADAPQTADFAEGLAAFRARRRAVFPDR